MLSFVLEVVGCLGACVMSIFRRPYPPKGGVHARTREDTEKKMIVMGG